MPFNAPSPRPSGKIAIIGSGIAGLSAAWMLNRTADIQVFEVGDHIGGHSNTLNAGTETAPLPVDTGFIVYNDRNYPNLVALFDHLDVPTKPSDMSFAASLDGGRFEYSGTGLNGLLGQRRNMISPRFWQMLGDLLRFYRTAPALIGDAAAEDQSLGDYLSANRYSRAFIRDHILPMGAAIWSTSAKDMLDYPLAAFVRFFHSHGLLQIANRPQWRTVDGGSVAYVRRLTEAFADRINRTGVRVVHRFDDHVELLTADGERHVFDEVVIATHADDALNLLARPTVSETALLGAFRYTANDTYLHTDSSLMPCRKRLWSSWNYLGREIASDDSALTVTYWMNRLQSIDDSTPLFVTLNPAETPESGSVIRRFNYQHPLFDRGAMLAQRSLWNLQGGGHAWFCGSYFGYGFHEDALESGLAVAEAISGEQRPWDVPAQSSRIHTCLHPTAEAV